MYNYDQKSRKLFPNFNFDLTENYELESFKSCSIPRYITHTSKFLICGLISGNPSQILVFQYDYVQKKFKELKNFGRQLNDRYCNNFVMMSDQGFSGGSVLCTSGYKSILHCLEFVVDLE